jgi:colanic acid biosynthesis protein WcaH
MVFGESNAVSLLMWLDDTQFEKIIEQTPLVSIDLIVRDEFGCVLLGQRSNRPAKGYWFVPGGRIQKGETIAAAFSRLTVSELGLEYLISKVRFHGVYQHFYDDNVFESPASTHYVVLGFEILLDRCELSALPSQQHESYQWFGIPKLLGDRSVHCNSKDYFRKSTSYR